MGAERDEFFKISIKLMEHPKVEKLSDKAFRALIDLWLYCARYRTDGMVDADAWRRRTSSKAQQELVAVGLVEKCDTDYYMHDYLDHQPSRAHIDKVSAKRAAAGSRGGRAKQNAKQNATRGSEAGEDHPSDSRENLTKIREKSATDRPPRSGDVAPPEAASPQVKASKGVAKPKQNGKQLAAVLPTREEEEEEKRTDPPTSGLPRPASRRGADLPRHPTPDMTVNERAQALTRRYYDSEPLSSFPAVQGIVKKAIDSKRYRDEQIEEALDRIAKDGRTVTIGVLRTELDGFAPSARGRVGVASPPRRSTVDDQVAALDRFKGLGPDT